MKIEKINKVIKKQKKKITVKDILKDHAIQKK